MRLRGQAPINEPEWLTRPLALPALPRPCRDGRNRKPGTGSSDRDGWAVTPDDQIPDAPPQKWYPATGGEIVVPAGIDPGFSYNPGTAHLRVVADKAISSLKAATEAGLEAAADATLRQIVADPAFDQFLALPHASFPVAILTLEQQAAISAKARVVVLPENIYRKQLGEMPEISRGHPELTPAQYRLLPDIIANALVVAQQGDHRLIYFTDAAGRLWKAVIRQDENRDLPAIVSFHGSSLRKLVSETRNMPILLDRRQ